MRSTQSPAEVLFPSLMLGSGSSLGGVSFSDLVTEAALPDLCSAVTDVPWYLSKGLLAEQ